MQPQCPASGGRDGNMLRSQAGRHEGAASCTVSICSSARSCRCSPGTGGSHGAPPLPHHPLRKRSRRACHASELAMALGNKNLSRALLQQPFLPSTASAHTSEEGKGLKGMPSPLSFASERRGTECIKNWVKNGSALPILSSLY